jgi:hypothetical protein
MSENDLDELTTNPLVAALLNDEGNPLPVRVLTGYIGPVKGSRRRIYLDDELQTAADVPLDSIRYHRRYCPVGASADVDVVWVVDADVTSWARTLPWDGGATAADENGDSEGGGVPGAQRRLRPFR